MSGPSRTQVVGGVATVAVGAAVVAGMFVLGAPTEERAFRLDERRVRDLSALAAAVDVYWRRFERLPESLDDLRIRMGANVSLNDPASGAPYEYRFVDAGAAFEVCATFERDSLDREGARFDGFWSHRTGRQCFRRTTPKLP